MSERNPPPPRSADRDADIDALLDFDPVPRKQSRRDGGTAERQRDFVAELAATGDRDRAAHAVGMTARGAYELRKSAGAEAFCRTWDQALELHARRGRRTGQAGLRPPVSTQVPMTRGDRSTKRRMRCPTRSWTN